MMDCLTSRPISSLSGSMVNALGDCLSSLAVWLCEIEEKSKVKRSDELNRLGVSHANKAASRNHEEGAMIRRTQVPLHSLSAPEM